MSVLCLVAVFNTLDRHIITVLLEPIKHSFGASDTAMGFLSGTAFACFYLLASFPVARWVDIGVRRTIMALCLGLWSLMTALGGVSQTFAQLAATRVGVAIGEAGAVPVTYSMISDLYSKNQRGAAIGTLHAVQAAGLALGMSLGGWLSDAYGWRTALIAVGVPGVILALIVRFTVAEPPRGMSEAKVEETVEPLAKVFKHLWSIRSYRCFVLMPTFCSLTGYAFLGWAPTFFKRVHGMSTAEVGLWLGLATAVGLFLGNLLSGFLSDRLGRRDMRWYMWISVVGLGAAAPLGLLTLLSPASTPALFLYFATTVFLTLYLPPVQAMVQNVAPQRMRGTAIVVMYAFQILVGIGLGPLLVGLSNDLLAPRFGAESIRYSLMFAMVGAPIAAVCALLATRWLRTDVAATEARQGRPLAPDAPSRA